MSPTMWRPARQRPPDRRRHVTVVLTIINITEDGDRSGQHGGPGQHGELDHLSSSVGHLAADGPATAGPAGEVLTVVAEDVVGGVRLHSLPVSHCQGPLHH